MRTKLILALIVLFPLAAFAGDIFNAKEGLWETSVTTGGSGAPGMSADTLAKMSPEQRAMVEQMMKKKGISMSGNTITVKSCVTKDKIAKGAAFADSRKNSGDCTRSVVKQTANHFEAKFHCESKDSGTTDGTVNVDLVGDGVKGVTHMTNTSKGESHTFDSNFTSKYLGPDCGDVK
ncbi:MAG: DUF3617 domain-containing protein [Terriglobales bacterium]